MALKARVVYSIAFFLLFMLLLVSTRPRWLFRGDGSPVPFGVGRKHTLFSLGTLTVVVSAASLFAFALLDLFYARRPREPPPFLLHMSGGGGRVPSGYA